MKTSQKFGFTQVLASFKKFGFHQKPEVCLKPKQHRNHMIPVYTDNQNESFCEELLALYPTQVRLEHLGNMLRVWISESLFELIGDFFRQERFQKCSSVTSILH